MKYLIQNELMICEIDSHGAELKSLIRKSDGRQFMWNADPKYWNRTSPVLFPFVGAVKDKTYRLDGKTYTMGQHGFARDMEFQFEEKTETEIWFSLSENEASFEKYPFCFQLRIGYRIEQETLRVMWQVRNTNEKEMWFAIGAHPGFAIDQLKGKAFRLYDQEGRVLERIHNRVFGTGGCVTDQVVEMTASGGILAISEELFANDALVLEKRQVGKVELLGEGQEVLVAVSFTAPLVGLWSPPHKNAPFVCIEPWYGRCDSATFEGELKEREYEQFLDAGKIFDAEYRISIGKNGSCN